MQRVVRGLSVLLHEHLHSNLINISITYQQRHPDISTVLIVSPGWLSIARYSSPYTTSLPSLFLSQGPAVLLRGISTATVPSEDNKTHISVDRYVNSRTSTVTVSSMDQRKDTDCSASTCPRIVVSAVYKCGGCQLSPRSTCVRVGRTSTSVFSIF